MHLIKNKVITLIAALVISVSGFSQFKINEYSCSNVSGTTDALGGTPDWFEIYNTSTSAKVIGGYYVSDDPSYPAKWQFPIGTTIPAQGFLVVYASGRDTVIYTPAVEYHTNFDLLQTKPEKIILSDNQGAFKDSVGIRRHKHNDAWGRKTNGNGAWRIFPKNAGGVPTSTPGATNAPASGIKSYNAYLPPPIFDQTGQFSSGPMSINLSFANGLVGTRMYYTGAVTVPLVIGADPYVNTAQRQEYLSGPITIDSTTVIRAFVDTADIGNNCYYLPSFVETNTYIINGLSTIPGLPGQFYNTDFTLPTISISFDPSTSGSYPGVGTGTAHQYMMSLEYFDKNHDFKFKTVGVTTATSADDQQIAGAWAGFFYSANDEYGFSYTNKQQLYTDGTLGTSGRQEQTTIQFKTAASDNFPYVWATSSGTQPSIHFRDALCQTYAMKNGLRLDGTHYQPCIMYINGEYSGIYEIREAFDTEYTDYYYDAEEIESCEYNGTLTSFPSQSAAANWGSMVNFITSNNMANDSLRAIADSMLNFGSLIDLVIYNSYTVNGQFPKKAAWWRAPDSLSGSIKWRYRMYDMDDTYGLNENNAGIPNTGYDGSVCQFETTFGSITDSSQAHLTMFNSLMVSDTFKSEYINRYSYLLNTSLKCAPIISHLNYIANLLSPEIQQHDYLIGLDDTSKFWNLNVDTTIYWINQRCPTITEDIKTCYNVTGPFNFCTDVMPPNSGTVYLNTVPYPEAHSDNYFGNVYFDAVGTPNENYVFDHWELQSFTLPDSMLVNDTLHWLFDSTSCITAVFKLKEPYQVVGEVIVPTGFSPNGDGNNDVLNVYGTRDASEFHLAVYNRWGQQLFESNDKTVGWDGKYKGQDVPVGVYAYVFKIKIGDQLTQKSGSITLIR